MSELTKHILALETALMSPNVRWSVERLKTILAPDFREFGRSGQAYGYDETIDALTSETTAFDVAIDDFELTVLCDTVALATYRTTRRVDDSTSSVSLRSSVWRFETDGTWRIIFHQGTPAMAS